MPMRGDVLKQWDKKLRKSGKDDPSYSSKVCHILWGNCTYNTSLINKFAKSSDVTTQKQITESLSRPETAMSTGLLV
jgi:hypothetical protein